MHRFATTSLTVKNYKLFGEEESGFSIIKPLNVIIGRNNSGKSALLDIVHYACEPYAINKSLYHRGQETEVLISNNVEETDIVKIFKKDVHNNGIPGQSDWDAVGPTLVGSRLILRQLHKTKEFYSFQPKTHAFESYPKVQEFIRFIRFVSPFGNIKFMRLAADRDIVPEAANSSMTVSPNGQGLTAAVAHIVNSAALPSELVEETILNQLNAVFTPDGYFSDLVVQQYSDGRWEIFLTEEKKGRVALSHSGSGLKTIILTVAFLELSRYLGGSELSTSVFAFEELENNLHPALQRRLLTYVRKKITDSESTVFITTHSSAIIDLFSNDGDAQIIHVAQTENEARTRQVTTYYDHHGILDDLDVRASDVLQANGVVWVEGPSDRLYFNRWVEIWTGGQIREGAHYQCIFYGGRLLAHLSAEDPEIDPDEAVKILRVNRNALVIMDSDKRTARGQIGETKQRIREEIREIGGIAWVTKGREIENYIPLGAIRQHFPGVKDPPQQFEAFSDYLKRSSGEREARRFKRNKAVYAERFLPFIERDEVSQVLDMQDRMTEVVGAIRKWNSLGSV